MLDEKITVKKNSDIINALQLSFFKNIIFHIIQYNHKTN
jgi:hypothetical protein